MPFSSEGVEVEFVDRVAIVTRVLNRSLTDQEKVSATQTFEQLFGMLKESLNFS